MSDQNEKNPPEGAVDPAAACCALQDIIAEIERSFFRTQADVGAHPHVMMVHNVLRGKVGLEPLRYEDLPYWDSPAGKYQMRSDSRLLHNAKSAGTDASEKKP